MEVRSSLSEVTFSFITSAEVKERAESITVVHHSAELKERAKRIEAVAQSGRCDVFQDL